MVLGDARAMGEGGELLKCICIKLSPVAMCPPPPLPAGGLLRQVIQAFWYL